MAITGLFGKDTIEALAFSRHADNSEDYLRRLAEQASDVVVVAVDADNRLTLLAGPVDAILKQNANALRSQSLLDIMRPDDRPTAARYLAACREAPKVRRRIEFQLAREGHSWCEIEIINSRRDDPSVGVLAFRICDISERKHAQVALLERSDMLRTLTEASPLAVVVEGLDGKVQMWNPAAERIFGWTVGEAIGRSTPCLLDDNELDHRNLHERVLNGEAFTALEAQRKQKDGRVINVSIWTAPLRDAAGRVSGIMEVVSDITERKQLEAQLRQVQKMEGIGQLAGGVAHDFNNLLTAIVGYTDMLARQLPAPEERSEVDLRDRDWQRIHDGVREIRRAVERAAVLTQGLLAFSRSQVLQPTIVDVNAVVHGMEALLLRLIGENVDLASFLDPSLARVKADVSQLDR